MTSNRKLLTIVLIIAALGFLYPGITQPVLSLNGTVENSRIAQLGIDMIAGNNADDPTRQFLSTMSAFLGFDRIEGQMEVFHGRKWFRKQVKQGLFESRVHPSNPKLTQYKNEEITESKITSRTQETKVRKQKEVQNEGKERDITAYMRIRLVQAMGCIRGSGGIQGSGGIHVLGGSHGSAGSGACVGAPWK